MKCVGFVLLLTLGLAACGDDDVVTTTAGGANTVEQTGTQANIRHLTVRETEFALDPAKAGPVEEGLVSIKLVNDGKLPHALAVEGPNGEVEFDGQVDAGFSGTLEVDLDKTGTYTMYCPLDGHRGKGMVGTITVSGTTPARGAEPTVTSTAPAGTQTTPTQTQTKTETTPTTTGSYGY